MNQFKAHLHRRTKEIFYSSGGLVIFFEDFLSRRGTSSSLFMFYQVLNPQIGQLEAPVYLLRLLLKEITLKF